MLSRSKIAKRLKRDIVKNLYLLSVNDCEEYRLRILESLNEFAERWEIEKRNIYFSIELIQDSLDLTYNKSGQFDRFLKKENLCGGYDQGQGFNKLFLDFDKIIYDYITKHPTKTKGKPYFSYDIFKGLKKNV